MNSNKKDLLYELVRTNFKLKYNDSVLGFIWVLLKPFLIFVMLYIVFSQTLEVDLGYSFQMYLLVGIVMYTYFNESIVGGMNSLLDKAPIILKVNFDRSLAVYSGQILALINLLVNLLILVFFSLFNDVVINIKTISFFVLVLVITTLFTMGISFFTSVIFVKFRDLLHITEITMQLLFYASAIFFPIEIVPEKITILFIKGVPARDIFEVNPLFILIRAAREALLLGEFNYLEQVLGIGIISLILVVAGRNYFNRKVKKVAEFF